MGRQLVVEGLDDVVGGLTQVEVSLGAAVWIRCGFDGRLLLGDPLQVLLGLLGVVPFVGDEAGLPCRKPRHRQQGPWSMVRLPAGWEGAHRAGVFSTPGRTSPSK